MMDNQRNRQIYRLWSPVYDAVLGGFFSRGRRRALELLALQPGEKLLIPGIGTGLDIPLLPPNVTVIGGDFSPEMLAKARQKVGERAVTLVELDAQNLDFPDASFDAVMFNLILSVVPDGKKALQEGWRVLRPGGRAVIFDKFLPETSTITPMRQLAGRIIRAFGTDPNRRLSEMIADLPGLRVACDEPSLLGGQYRVIRLDKQA
ncbi:MAG TPA: methyltransferase domain-containing protein [Phototrophicaceae bacterium]|nr:methyltransferase domain-containing protein [Phototrophicaceae bacterium]